MNEAKLIDYIIRLAETQNYLKVEWDAGGDDRLVSVFIEGPKKEGEEEQLSSEIYEIVAYQLIDSFGLPQNGEVSDQGKGILSVEKNSEGKPKVMMTYDQFAYWQEYGEEVEMDKSYEDIKIPLTKPHLKFIKQIKEEYIWFDGSIGSFEDDQEYFDLGISEELKLIHEDIINNLFAFLKEKLFENMKKPTPYETIMFSGGVEEGKIYFDDLTKTTYDVYEDEKQVKVEFF
ncbi:MAG: hypothetical protein AAFY71_09810 [Bacteroidota bacterium]